MPPLSSSTPPPVRTFHPPRSSSRVLSHLLTDQTFADLTVHTATQTFQCHRAILAAASPVFHAMFTSAMRESKTGHLHLSHVPASVFQPIRQYMYGQPFVLHPHTTIDVSSFIRQYQIGDSQLVDFLDDLLCAAVSITTVLGIRTHAQLHSIWRVTRACDRFLAMRMAKLGEHQQFLDSSSEEVVIILGAPMRVSRDVLGKRWAQGVLKAALEWLAVEGRNQWRKDILSVVQVEALGLPALVRVSRDENAMADDRFRERVLRAFVKRAEGDLGFEKHVALGLLGARKSTNSTTGETQREQHDNQTAAHSNCNQ